MGVRRLTPVLLMVAAIGACAEQDQSEDVTGPQFAPPIRNATACVPNSLNSLISGYFPGSSSSYIKSLSQAMLSATTDAGKRDKGFEILDSIGSVSRKQTVDAVAGSDLTKGVIKCMFNAAAFSPSFPSDPIYDFAPALSHPSGGAFYVRGGTTGGTETVVGASITSSPHDTTVLSGVAPPSGSTWTSILATNTGSEGRVLLYGYRVGATDPLVYEWATIPPAATFSPGAIVAVCDDNTATTTMVHETNVGVLEYSPVNAICGATISTALREAGPSPRPLAARLARVLVSAMTPTSLHAAAVLATKSGTGGTVTTVKSKFSTKPVEKVTLKFTVPPSKTMYLGNTYLVEVRATAVVDGVSQGVNGTCVYLTGTNNNGQNTALTGTHDDSCHPLEGAAYKKTESKTLGGQPTAGYAVFALEATKAGGLLITAGSSDDSDSDIGVIGRDGQTFQTDQVKINVKP
ncbi:hypothetical protein BH24GEM1_BH24GEM1_07440 [soil metagenome]